MPLQHSVKEVALQNGAKGLFILVPGSTSVSYEIQFRAGNHYAKHTKISQVAHIMEHMAFGANRDFDSVESFSHVFTRNGAYSNAQTGTIELTYMASCPLMEWERIIDLETLSITKPKYTQEFLEAEKGNVREEIVGYLDDDGRVLTQQMLRSVGLKRWFDAEELQTIAAVTMDDVYEHYERTHTTRNMRFVFAGDLEAHMPALIEKLEAWELPAGEQFLLPQETVAPTGLVHVQRENVHNIQFVLTFYVNRRLTRDEQRTMNVLRHVLTGTLHSRIWGAARARGISYGVETWGGNHMSGVAEFSVGGEVSHENSDALFALVAEQLLAVAQDGISDDELAQAKSFHTGELQMDLETVQSLVDWYDDTYYLDDTVDPVSDMPALINATTARDVRVLAQEFVTSGFWTFGGLTNISKEALQKHYDAFAKAWTSR